MFISSPLDRTLNSEMLSCIGLYLREKAFAKRLNINSVIQIVAVKMTHPPLQIQIFPESMPELFNEKYRSY